MSQVTVTLTVFQEHESKVHALCERGFSGPAYSTETENLVGLLFEYVRHGSLPFLHELRRAGVPFDSRYEAGDDFGPGVEYCRYSPEGELISREILDSELNPPIEELMQLIDKPVALRAYIRAYHATHTVPPLDQTQVQNGKLWQARLLIDPTIFP